MYYLTVSRLFLLEEYQRSFHDSTAAEEDETKRSAARRVVTEAKVKVMVGQEEEGEKQLTSSTKPASSSSFWSIADDCAHYAALGCHVASVARYFKPPTEHTKKKSGGNNNSNKCSNILPVISSLHASSLGCKEEMYQCAMQQHP